MGEYARVKVERTFMGIRYRRTETLPHRLRDADETLPEIDPGFRLDVDLIQLNDILAAHRVIAKRGTTDETVVAGRVIEGYVVSVNARSVVIRSDDGSDAVLPLCDYLDSELIVPPRGVVEDMEGPDAPGPDANGRLPGELFICRYAFYLMGKLVDGDLDELEPLAEQEDYD